MRKILLFLLLIASAVSAQFKTSGGFKTTGGFCVNAEIIRVDKNGNENVMEWIPAFNWDRTNGFASTTIHPAFVVNDVEIPGFLVSKYECRLLDGSGDVYSAGTVTGSAHSYIANSAANKVSRWNIDFDGARKACANMNNGSTITGWHLMTNAEWAAIALWSKENSTQPYGNNNYGADKDNTAVTGTIIPGDTFGSGNSRWLTGSGGPLTTHNWVDGIADMNGNLWEWVDGFYVSDGKIYVAGNKNISPTWAGNSFAATEGNWYDTGMYINWDGTSTYCSFSAVGRGSVQDTYKSKSFGTMTGADSLLQAIAVGPVGSSAAAYNNDYVYLRNDGLRFPIRSGHWNFSTLAGVFYLNVSYERTYALYLIGFRSALIEGL